MKFNVELPKRIEGESFLSEVYNNTIRQCFPKKDLEEKSIFGCKRKHLYAFVFLPLFIWAFSFMLIYMAAIRLLKKKSK